MSFILSPNMNLPVPVVGQEPGPTYAQDVNNALALVDAHDHTPGNGVPITPSGMNINSTLNFNGNGLSNVALVNLTAQSMTPGISTIYQSGFDLYFVDALGNNIQITANGGIAGSPGSISNLTPPASAAYVAGSSKFVWQSDANIAANMDFGAAIMRNISPNSTNALTLQPPANLSSNFTLTLPVIPGSDSFLTINTSGAMSGSIPIAGGITASNIAAGTITDTQISPTAGIQATKLAPVWNTTLYTSGTTTWTVPAGVTSAIVEFSGGGGGGGGGGGSHGNGPPFQGGGGGGGGEGVESFSEILALTPAESVSVVVGAAGSLGTGGAHSTGTAADGTSGTDGGSTTVTALSRTLKARGGKAGTFGHGATATNGGTGGTGGNSLITDLFGGNAGGGGTNNAVGAAGTAGQQNAPQFLGGAAGASSGGFSGGGGGGGGGGPSTYGVGQDGAANGNNSGPGNASSTNTVFGSGGGGGGGGSGNASTTGRDGGNGGPGGSGYVRITWWGPAV